MHSLNHATAQINVREITNTVYLLQFNFICKEFPNSTQLISSHMVSDLFTDPIIQGNLKQISETSNSLCILKSPFNCQI